MVAGMVAANIEMHMVAGMEVEKVAYKVADMVADIKKSTSTSAWKSKLVGELVTGLNWPKLFRPEALPACASSKFCKFINLLACLPFLKVPTCGSVDGLLPLG